MAANNDPASPSSKPANVRRKVHIRIGYRGKGQPGAQLKERCDTLVGMLVAQDAGVIDGRNAGAGAVDIFVITRFADHTIEKARKIAIELGISTRAKIQIVEG